MQSFRASPWVSYEPSLPIQQDRDQPISGSEMDEDMDMDAPRISTLRDEESPPPTGSKKGTANTRKRSHMAAMSTDTWGHSVAKQEVYDLDDDEEDQLIEDDDNGDATRLLSSRSTDTVQKRKPPVKRKSRKGEKKAGELEKKVKDQGSPPGAQGVAPTISIFKANPTDSHEDVELNTPPALAESSAPKGKKKLSPAKPRAIPRAKGKMAKQKSAVPHLLAIEDTGVLSESYAGTAASSPVTAPFDLNSPEPENLPPSSPLPAPITDEPPNLENVPIPVYPLPTKPFPVQLPQKISTGFAPLIPLDKGGKKVRHWREANREIRGIAGGRWFAKTWVGDKESELATHLATKSADEKASAGALLKLPSTPVISKAIGKLKASSKSGSVSNSANPSRAPSVDAPGNPVTSAVRAPTKMRISQKAPSENSGTPALG